MNNYEAAELVSIGSAEEKILGVFFVGSDADGTTFPGAFSYMEDAAGE